MINLSILHHAVRTRLPMCDELWLVGKWRDVTTRVLCHRMAHLTDAGLLDVMDFSVFCFVSCCLGGVCVSK